eukprot:CAMPEP_0184708328 /NCGR_PEP_ID=MMETSP0313-20130426/37721_1 /TAXON_ID=2792 /ORGANISM="Porphyridium aerugineum, Strain SAG 1380-2" /LENGTH=377 /DNA_ID=CAMNT_0027169915 /DNA_START=97 /DNA_END=1230 /DNA_ORIENTATION=-
MEFLSDTLSPTHEAVLQAIRYANDHPSVPSYGGSTDPFFQLSKSIVCAVFETPDLDIWPCISGTASNALALSAFCPCTGSIICHEEAHIQKDERGAPEFFTNGGKLELFQGKHGKLNYEQLEKVLSKVDRNFVHETPPHVLSITNLTESGTVYTVEEIRQLSTLAHQYDLKVHMDGARFGNAVMSTGSSPAELTWKAGVDFLTLGLTKTGAMGCEVIIIFGQDNCKRMHDLYARAKRSGHMPPKIRYFDAQIVAMLGHAKDMERLQSMDPQSIQVLASKDYWKDGLWLQLASHANAMAQHLSNAFLEYESQGISLMHPVQGNEVFVKMPGEMAEYLKSRGARFYHWPGDCYRFVCAWNTKESQVQLLKSTLKIFSSS